MRKGHPQTYIRATYQHQGDMQVFASLLFIIWLEDSHVTKPTSPFFLQVKFWTKMWHKVFSYGFGILIFAWMLCKLCKSLEWWRNVKGLISETARFSFLMVVLKVCFLQVSFFQTWFLLNFLWLFLPKPNDIFSYNTTRNICGEFSFICFVVVTVLLFVLLLFIYFFSFCFCFLRQSLKLPRLPSDLLYIQAWPWTSDPPVPPYQVLRRQYAPARQAFFVICLSLSLLTGLS